MTLKDIILNYRLSHGLSQRQFAAKCSVSNGYISMLEKEENPSTGEKITPKLSALEKLAGGMGMSLSELLDALDSEGELPLMDGSLGWRISGIVNVLNDDGLTELIDYGSYLLSRPEYSLPPGAQRGLKLEVSESTANQRLIRHYLVPAAAGYASPVDGEDYELVPLPLSAPAAADFCISVSGDSMEPYIMDGQDVYVQRDATVKDGDVGVFYYNGDVYIKLYCKDVLGNVYLLSANPARQDANIEISRDSGASLVCFGRVLLSRHIPMP